MTAIAEATTLVPKAPLEGFAPSPLNPRKNFSDASLLDITANIFVLGEVVQPLLVRTMKGGKVFEIIDGERRWRGSKAAGNIKQIPYLLRDDLTDGQCIEIMLLSSIHKRELSPLEEAAGFKAWMAADAKNTLAYIADRIGRSQKHIADRMRLLDLIPVVKKLLEQDRIMVGHAESLAKLTPEWQQTVASPNGPLFLSEAGGLFEDDKDPYAGRKTITVRELDAYIAKHIRFDVVHSATTAPLDFGPLAERVEAAQAVSGRGRKTVAITYETFVQPSAKSDEERTFGPAFWKRADGTKGTTVIEHPKHKVVDSPKCEFAVLGVIVVGDDRGTGFDVCLAREKCETHWGDEMRAKKKAADQRAKGQSGSAAKTEQRSAEKDRLENEAIERRRAAWKALAPHIVDEAAAQVKLVSKLTAAQGKAVLNGYIDSDRSGAIEKAAKRLGPNWFKNLTATLLTAAVIQVDTYSGSFEQYVKKVAKPLGLNVKKLEAVRDKHTPKVEASKAESKAGK